VYSSKESILMYSASNFSRSSINLHLSLPGLGNPNRVMRARGVILFGKYRIFNVLERVALQRLEPPEGHKT